MRIRSLLGLLVVTLGAGCGFLDGFGADGGTPSTTDAARMFGYGKPTLNITVGGQHFGPAAPDPGAAAQLVNMRDGQGRIISSRFTLIGSVLGDKAACALAFERVGLSGVASIDVRGYVISSGNAATTADGTVAPTGTQAIAVPGATLACSSNTCAGGSLTITALDATHVEGDASGTWADTLGRGNATVVCSFYLPITNWQP